MDCETLLRIDEDGVVRNTVQEYDGCVPEICPQPVVACVWKGAINEDAQNVACQARSIVGALLSAVVLVVEEGG